MECFKNIIGLREICETNTGLIINDLPGISLQMISNLSNEDRTNYKEVFNSIETHAINEMQADLLPELAKVMQPTTLVENYQAARIKTPYNDVAAATKYRGLTLEHLGSKYARFYINDVQLQSNSAGSYTIKIFDYNTGQELDQYTGTLTEGINTIPINKGYNIQGQTKRLFVAYDATAIDSKDTIINPYQFTTINGAEITIGDTPTKENIDFGSNTFGLSVNFNLECSLELFACQYRDMLKFALWYKMGDSFMLERLASDRVNQYTLVNMEQAKELRDLYNTKYAQSFEAVINSISTTAGDECFACEGLNNYQYNLP